MRRFEAEGEEYASHAVAWAATMTHSSVQKTMRDTLAKLRRKLLLIEQEYARLFEERQVLARTC